MVDSSRALAGPCRRASRRALRMVSPRAVGARSDRVLELRAIVHPSGGSDDIEPTKARQESRRRKRTATMIDSWNSRSAACCLAACRSVVANQPNLLHRLPHPQQLPPHPLRALLPWVPPPPYLLRPRPPQRPSLPLRQGAMAGRTFATSAFLHKPHRLGFRSTLATLVCWHESDAPFESLLILRASPWMWTSDTTAPIR